MTPTQEPLLRLDGVHVTFDAPSGSAHILDGVNLSIQSGEILGIVGESGSGKSVTAMSIIQLLQKPGRISGGRIVYKGTDLMQISKEEMRKIRGNEISMIFQNPRSALNPVFKIGRVINEVLKIHEGLSGAKAHKRAIELLSNVGLADPESVLTRYPHQVSGGMAQRVMIALALASRPSLLIADEPTTALDVTIQYQIIQLLKRLQKEADLTQIVITHNLGVVAELCERVVVMYAGTVVEEGRTIDIFDSPKHPYTRGLLAARAAHASGEGKLQTIPGQVPDLRERPTGCPFHPRCAFATKACSKDAPSLMSVGENHKAACLRWEEIS